MSAAPNPQNFLLLAGLGIAAYWVMTRSSAFAGAGGYSTPAQIPAQGIANPYVGGIANAIGNLFRGAASAGTYDGRSATPWNTDTSAMGGAGAANNPSAFIATSQVDGVAFNPTAQSVFDAFNDQDALASVGGFVL